MITTTILGGLFPIRYSCDEPAVQSLLSRVKTGRRGSLGAPPLSVDSLKRYARVCLEYFGIRGHPTNWKSIGDKELLLVISQVQRRGAPAVTAENLRDPLKELDAVADGPSRPDIDPYVPNNILISPSLIEGAGMGAFARHKIPKETFLGSYSGTAINKEARMKKLTIEQDNRYVFSVYRTETNSRRFVVAFNASHIFQRRDSRNRVIEQAGSWHRFINTGVPNVEFRVFTPDRKRNKTEYRVDLFTLRDIQAGEELIA